MRAESTEKRQNYIEKAAELITYEKTREVIFAAVVVVLLSSATDYLTTPVHFKTFFSYRLAAAFGLTLILLVVNIRGDRTAAVGGVMSAGIISAILVEVMMIQMGGHVSAYFAGHFIVIGGILGIVPLFSSLYSVLTALALYSIYIVPLVVSVRTESWTATMGHASFIGTATILTALYRISTDKGMLKSIELQYRLTHELERSNNEVREYREQVQKHAGELKVADIKARCILDHTNDSIIIMRTDGSILDASKKACEIYGFDIDSLIGTNVAILDASKKRINQYDYLRKGGTQIFETIHYKKNGDKIKLRIEAKQWNTWGVDLIYWTMWLLPWQAEIGVIKS